MEPHKSHTALHAKTRVGVNEKRMDHSAHLSGNTKVFTEVDAAHILILHNILGCA